MKNQKKENYVVFVPFRNSYNFTGRRNAGAWTYSGLVFASLQKAREEAAKWSEAIVVKIMSGKLEMQK